MYEVDIILLDFSGPGCCIRGDLSVEFLLSSCAAFRYVAGRLSSHNVIIDMEYMGGIRLAWRCFAA